MPLTVAFITLGCAKNEVDSNHMRAALAASHYVGIDDPEQASIVIVNTCAFITEATEEAIEVIFDVLALDNVRKSDAKVVVTGCMPSRYGTQLVGELPEVDLFVSAADEGRIVELLDELFGESLDELLGVDGRSHLQNPEGVGSPNRAKTLLSRQQPQQLQQVGASGSQAMPFNRVVDAPWAYVKISDGCSRNCAFCTIPAIRGEYRSVPFAQIAAEVRGLVERGVQEIILIGQDTGIWGRDLQDHTEAISACPQNLAQLLDSLACEHPDVWLRVMYLQPSGLNDELLATMAAHSNICNYLDIPLQHAAPDVLQAMNRAGSGAQYLQMVERIRASLPSAALRTTLIAGFPGETRSQSAALQCFIESAEFDYAGVFVYSQESGTVAGERTNQVPLRTRRARAQRLRDAADQIGFGRVELRIGSTCKVLICGEDEQGVWGRSQYQAPDVDGVVYVEGLSAQSIGNFIEVKIDNSACYDLFAHSVG